MTGLLKEIIDKKRTYTNNIEFQKLVKSGDEIIFLDNSLFHKNYSSGLKGTFIGFEKCKFQNCESVCKTCKGYIVYSTKNNPDRRKTCSRHGYYGEDYGPDTFHRLSINIIPSINNILDDSLFEV